MAALAEKVPVSPTPSPAAVGCHRAACLSRGTACQACLRRDVQRVALTDGQASFILRTKLSAACVEGEAFEVAWARATAEIITRSAQGQARSWRVTLEAVRPEFADAYRRKRLALGERAATLA